MNGANLSEDLLGGKDEGRLLLGVEEGDHLEELNGPIILIALHLSLPVVSGGARGDVDERGHVVSAVLRAAAKIEDCSDLGGIEQRIEPILDRGEANVDLVRSSFGAFEKLDVDEHLSGELADEDELDQYKGITLDHSAHGFMRGARDLQVSRGGGDNCVPVEHQLLGGLVERGPANSNEGGDRSDLEIKIEMRSRNRTRAKKESRTLP